MGVPLSLLTLLVLLAIAQYPWHGVHAFDGENAPHSATKSKDISVVEMTRSSIPKLGFGVMDAG